MEKKLSKLYLEIGKKMISMIPTKWNKIYYLGEVEKKKASWSSVFYFEDGNTKKIIKSHSIPDVYNVSERIYDELLMELDQIMLKIYDCFVIEEQPEWEQISMVIDNKGRFSVDYFYNKIKPGHSQVLREIIWAYETFNLIPPEGSYKRDLFDDYINIEGFVKKHE